MQAVRISAVTVAALTLAATAVGQEARYRVVFDSQWSSSSHPTAFPPNAHFSPLIGATHNDQVAFWGPGELATPGIESMAETGQTPPLTSEINVARSAGTAGVVISGGGLGALPNALQTSFRMDADYPLVTLVTMIAPSPDWFVGTNGLPLRDNGVWLDNVVVDLEAWDAGTDSGSDFTSGNVETNPAEAIRLISGEAPFAGNPASLGTFTFVLLELPCPGDTDGDGDVDLSDLAAVLAGFGLSDGAVVADGDVTNDRAVDLDDLSTVLANFAAACPN